MIRAKLLTLNQEYVIAKAAETFGLALLPLSVVCFAEPIAELKHSLVKARRTVDDDIGDGRILGALDLEIAQADTVSLARLQESGSAWRGIALALLRVALGQAGTGSRRHGEKLSGNTVLLRRLCGGCGS